MRSMRIWIVVLVAALATAAGLAISGGAGVDATTPVESGAGVAAPDPPSGSSEWPEPAEDLRRWNRPALPPVPAPPGKRAIAFNDGGTPGLAGYLVDEGPNGWDEPDPVLDLGSGRYEVRGEEVTDLDGVLLGYLISTIGLVDLETALDDEALDVLLAKAEAQRAAAPQMSEDEIAERYGITTEPHG